MDDLRAVLDAVGSERTAIWGASDLGLSAMFAATYALGVVHCTQPHTQVIVVGQDEIADRLCRVALHSISFNKAVIRFSPSAVTPQNLPPVLAETIPNLPALQENRSFAVVCSGSTCQAPVFDSAELSPQLDAAPSPAA